MLCIAAGSAVIASNEDACEQVFSDYPRVPWCCLPQFNIALAGFARRISAPSCHTISQTSLLGERPAVRRKPSNPGAGHEASPCPCRRPSMVTEGADPPPVRPHTTEAPVIYGVFCLRCCKASFFYGVSGPSAAKDFILAMLKNIGFFHGFGLQEGARGGKIGILRSFQ